MELASNTLNNVKGGVNNLFANHQPWQIVSITATTVLTTVWLYDLIHHSREGITLRTKKAFFKCLRKLPAIRRKIEMELGPIRDGMFSDVEKRQVGLESVAVLPAKGATEEVLLELVKQHVAKGDYNWSAGRVSGAVYCQDEILKRITTAVYGLAAYTNPLHSDVFPGVNKMEAEVIRMTINLFHGGPGACGTMTTGGTESIMMACKAHRDRAYERGVKWPEMVLPATAHPAFDKSAKYFGIRVRLVPINPVTCTVNVRAMWRAINRNTCMIVASAPNFPYGTMDDVSTIAGFGERLGIPVHVDACLGGFLLAFMPQAGYPLPPFDFRLPGVSSISADTHKYGYAPKGSSVVMYREESSRHFQYTVSTDWPGGVYGSPTVNGSRAGGVVAACWATMRYFGEERYVEMTTNIIQTTRFIEQKLRKVEGIYIFGTPATSVVAVGSKKFDIFLLSGALHKLGWSLNALQFPSGFHLCVTNLHTQDGVADAFIEDVKRETAVIMKNPKQPVEGKMAVYGVAQSIPDRSLVAEITHSFLDAMYYVPKAAALKEL